MRVVSLIDAISGGGGMVMYNIIKGSPHHEHIIISPESVKSWSIGLPKLIADTGVKVDILHAMGAGPVMHALDEKILHYDPDIIINHWWRSSRMQRLNQFGKTRKVYGRAKTILVSHNNDPSVPGYNYYVSVSKHNSVFQVHANKERKGRTINHRVIYNGIDVERFNVQRNVDPDKFVIGRISSLVKFKISRDWIPFANTFHIPNVKHIIVGEGERRHQFEYDVAKLGVQHKFEFPGEIPSDSIPQMLARFNIILYATEKTEAFSLAMLEAMAAGLPIVTQNSGGMPEQVVHGKTGFLANSRQELRQYCELLAKHPDLLAEMSKAARERSHLFTIEKMAQEYEKLFYELMNGIYG